MPRYFFDTDDGEGYLRDDEGAVFPSLQEACDEAVRLLPNIAIDILPKGERRDFISVVRDEKDQVIFKATLSLITEWLIPQPIDGTPKEPKDSTSPKPARKGRVRK